MINTNGTTNTTSENNTTNEDYQTNSTTSETRTTSGDNQTNSTNSTTSKDDKITVKVNGKLKEQFRRKALANGTNPTNLINQLMWEYVNGTTSTGNTTGEDNQTNSTTNETNSTAKTNTELESRLATIEATLEQIDFSDILTAAHTIEHGSAIAQQNRKSIADLEKVVEELQAESLEVNHALKGKVTPQQLYERLAAATETIWESLDYMGDKIENLEHPSENPPSEIGLEAAEEDSEVQFLLDGKEGDTAQNNGIVENKAQNAHCEEGSEAKEDAIAPKEPEDPSKGEDAIALPTEWHTKTNMVEFLKDLGVNISQDTLRNYSTRPKNKIEEWHGDEEIENEKGEKKIVENAHHIKYKLENGNYVLCRVIVGARENYYRILEKLN
jgi:hypothetical protein